MSSSFHTHTGNSSTLVNDLDRIRCPLHSSFSQVTLQAKPQVRISYCAPSSNRYKWLTHSWPSVWKLNGTEANICKSAQTQTTKGWEKSSSGWIMPVRLWHQNNPLVVDPAECCVTTTGSLTFEKKPNTSSFSDGLTKGTKELRAESKTISAEELAKTTTCTCLITAPVAEVWFSKDNRPWIMTTFWVCQNVVAANGREESSSACLQSPSILPLQTKTTITGCRRIMSHSGDSPSLQRRSKDCVSVYF